jgi:hypothetical protein
MREFGKVHTSFWSSPTVQGMSDDGKLLALYLMTSPHNAVIGAFRLPDAYAAEDLGWSAERVKLAFKNLADAGFASRCERTKWVWIHKHLAWNEPESPNHRKAAARMAAAIPAEVAWRNEFFDRFASALGVEIDAMKGPAKPLPSPTEALAKPLPSPTEALAKPLPSPTEALAKPLPSPTEGLRHRDRDRDRDNTETETETETSWDAKVAEPLPTLVCEPGAHGHQAGPCRTDPSPNPSKPPPKKRPGRQAPADFVLSDGLREWALVNASMVNLEVATCAFRDHTFKNAISDWDGAWRNWMRREQERREFSSPQRPTLRAVAGAGKKISYGSGGLL